MCKIKISELVEHALKLPIEILSVKHRSVVNHLQMRVIKMNVIEFVLNAFVNSRLFDPLFRTKCYSKRLITDASYRQTVHLYDMTQILLRYPVHR